MSNDTSPTTNHQITKLPMTNHQQQAQDLAMRVVDTSFNQITARSERSE
jgi:hypothetical protein